jgi:hypothetical protein
MTTPPQPKFSTLANEIVVVDPTSPAKASDAGFHTLLGSDVTTIDELPAVTIADRTGAEQMNSE